MNRLEPSLLNHTVSTNLSGAFFATQAAARQMAQAQSPPGGSIIGISSISALVGGGEQTHYTPTKAGVLSLMQSTAVALGKYGIRCNALLPGTIRTQLNDADMADPVKRTYMEGRIPLGRLGQPRDLAGPAVFLACEELSSYVVSFPPYFLCEMHLLIDFACRLVRSSSLTVDYLLICSENGIVSFIHFVIKKIRTFHIIAEYHKP